MQRSMRAPKPIVALSSQDCFEAVRVAAEKFAETTNSLPRFASRSWFLNEFARLLGQIDKKPGREARPALQVATELGFTYLGNFHHLIDSPSDPPIDLLACPPWSHLKLDDEEYGTDQRFLPPFYVIRLQFNQEDKWDFPEDIAEKIAGPLTVTMININVFGPERAFHAARGFERHMKKQNISHGISTQFLIPGILAAVTSVESTDPHQVLVASQTYDRDPVPNTEFVKERERRHWRG